MLRGVSFLAVALFATALAAQEKLVEQIEVGIVDVDVVVTDRFGKTVPALTRDDFEIFENGKPQTISNFAEIRGDSSQPPASTALVAARPRRFLLFIDTYSLDPSVRAEVIASMENFVDAMGPDDEASVVSWNRRLNILAGFFRQTQSITIKKGEERGFRATPITYSATLTVRPGENLLSVGILDQAGRTAGFARTTITSQ